LKWGLAAYPTLVRIHGGMQRYVSLQAQYGGCGATERCDSCQLWAKRMTECHTLVGRSGTKVSR
jgi:hypothetical protein